MQISSYIRLIVLFFLCFGSSQTFAQGGEGLDEREIAQPAPDIGDGKSVKADGKESYVSEDIGRSSVRSLFDSKKPTASEQWDYARETQKKGHLKRAERRMQYLHRRWPNSKEAPWAARARADIIYERGKWTDAFNAYQYLIDNYPSRMRDYDGVLQRQFELSFKIMEKRRMRWLFGGYRAPEYAVDFFEQVIRNGPQWKRASEAQFMIGKCNQDAHEYELAITAYGVLGYRYPNSQYAEEAAWQQIVCLRTLQEKFPHAPEMLDRTLTATTVFLSTYSTSEYKSEIIQLRNRLYEVKAGMVFDEAAFYAKVPKEPEAAIIYYEKLIEEYPKSKLVPYAEERIAALRALMEMPVKARTAETPRSKPLPFTKDSGNVEG